MFLLPCPELSQLKKFHISLILTLFLVFTFGLVEFFKFDIAKHDFSEYESNIYLNIQVKLYEKHLAQLKNFKNSDQRFIASILEKSDMSDKKIVGSISRASILDSTFDPITQSSLGLDPIAYQDWLSVHLQMKESLNLSPSYLMGLNDIEYGFSRWVSYMFVHIGIYHLISNCLFLLLFGALIETLLGGVVVCLVFLGSGFLAAPIYMFLSGLNQASMVGASGGVCGLVAFYSVYQIRHNMRFFYWVLPFDNYYGFTNLNSGLILVMWIAGDLAGYFSGVAFLDSVAYAAHLGGFLVGSMCALGLILYDEIKSFRTAEIVK